MLHVECAVGNPLAIKNEELLEGPVDRAVRNARRLDAFTHLSRHIDRAALQKRKSIRIEQHTMTLW